ncbi:hypothetical protein ACI65C_009205 [Semiaphis heraclei]
MRSGVRTLQNSVLTNNEKLSRQVLQTSHALMLLGNPDRTPENERSISVLYGNGTRTLAVTAVQGIDYRLFRNRFTSNPLPYGETSNEIDILTTLQLVPNSEIDSLNNLSTSDNVNNYLVSSTPKCNLPKDCISSPTLKYNNDISTVMEHSLCTEYSHPSSEDTITSYNMKVLIILGLVAFVISTVSSINLNEVIEEEWSLFKIQFKKIYEDIKEETFRKKVYLDNKLKIARHNKLYESGEETYALEMNHFGDLMQHEYTKMMNGFKPSLAGGDSNFTNDEAVTFLKSENVVVPKSMDWRKKGYVTPVKNQGQCGSCWSFSATGALEGQHFRKTGVLVSLSEQNLIDCSRKYGNNGCEGGLMDNAFKYIKSNKGLDTEKSYPYEAEDDKCRYDPENSGATDKGYVDIPTGNEEALMHALATVGPVSIAIDASSEKFQFYKKGVFYNPRCSSTELDHGVLAVGYGSDRNGGDYWIVKNSWGKTWGDEGYIKMARNKKNNCGVASSASYPLV